MQLTNFDESGRKKMRFLNILGLLSSALIIRHQRQTIERKQREIETLRLLIQWQEEENTKT